MEQSPMEPITVKLPTKEKAKFRKRVKNSGCSQSDVLRTALAVFFETNKTPAEIIDAVIRQRTAQAAKEAA